MTILAQVYVLYNFAEIGLDVANPGITGLENLAGIPGLQSLGTMRCVVGALKDSVCWRHRMQVCCSYNVRRRTRCRALYDAGLYFHNRAALTIESRTVIVFTKEIVYPVVDVVWYPQSGHFAHQGLVPHRIESLREVKRENSYVLVGGQHRAYSVQYSYDSSGC